MDFYPQILMKFPNIKCHDNLCSGYRAVACGGTDRWTDGQTEIRKNEHDGAKR